MPVCKKCSNRKFKTLSALRTHQWKAHRESYDGVKLRNWPKPAVPRAPGLWKDVSPEDNSPEFDSVLQPKVLPLRMTAEDLLAKLIKSRDRLNESIALVENAIATK